MLKILLHWFLAAFVMMITAHFIPGFEVSSLSTGLLAAVIVGLLNVLVWPILALLTLPLTLLTFGLFLFVVNAVVLKFGAALVPGFEIIGFAPAILGAVFMTAIGWLIRLLLHPEEDK